MNIIYDLMIKFIKREKYHPIVTYPYFLYKILCCKKRYRILLNKLRNSKESINVLFLSAGTAKWKCQSIYNEMVKSNIFVLNVLCGDDERNFYEELGCSCINDRLQNIKPDIVFYQDPWSELAGNNPVWKVSRSSLCCYVPYSIESIAQEGRSERFDYHHMADFHSLMYACFQWSEAYAQRYQKACFSWEWAGRILGFGHPMLDLFYNKRNNTSEYIIYAPHFSFAYNSIKPISSIGTFPWSGKVILEYAKKHPEQKWLFKPHPRLRSRLVEIHYMTENEVDLYYREWENIGSVCYDGNYANWFMKSIAMVTDSNSFLLEYMAVGKPLIHLKPEKTNMKACVEAETIFKTFYVAKSETELKNIFKLVVEERQDPKQNERLQAAISAEILDNHAGRRIVKWLINELSR